ncbi:Xyloglucanase precursor [Pigmentiphaga humi]|uniref:Xyloglucanase n=1 Tax=Pigmentiphaga humi TaxID=2478468 RepID=A0A3P4B7M7_9BURK|nr:hypothetical protein [Pigmentiphaga humi]VCU71941.1 Xyloglucanase precursor [Pigmentiphaga humi]
MSRRIEAYVGTAGHSAWFSDDQGATWIHPNSHSGMYLEARVWAFSSHPDRPELLWAGTDMGVFKWDERTTRWTHVPSPIEDAWALCQQPDDPDVIYAGGRPAGLYRSQDGGASWETLSVPGLADFSPINRGPTRVTQILVDPMDNDVLWASIEIGGIFRSADRGKTWTSQVEGLVSLDVHGIAVIRRPGGRLLLATTNQGLHRSEDEGAHWTFQPLDSPWQYTRAVVPRADTDRIVFLTNGNGPPGTTGRLLRSVDYGDTWQELPLPGRLNSTVWCVATHPHDPMLLLVCTNLGQIFRSRDGGDSWERLPHEFGEVRALHWRWAEIPEGRPGHAMTVRN